MAKREIKTMKDVTPDIVDEVTTPDIVDEVTKVEFVGTVTNCSKLNVRKEAKAKSDVITIVNANTNVSVNVSKSTEDWYFVKVGKFYGYCMKKYISIEA